MHKEQISCTAALLLYTQQQHEPPYQPQLQLFFCIKQSKVIYPGVSLSPLCGSIFVSLRILLGNLLAAPAANAHRRFPITYYSKGLSPRIRRAAERE
jgi:hypothetical protein